MMHRARLGEQLGVMTDCLIGWGQSPDVGMVIFIPDGVPTMEGRWTYRADLEIVTPEDQSCPTCGQVESTGTLHQQRVDR